jgi:hypothetical protein
VWGKTAPEQQVLVPSANFGLYSIAKALIMKTNINPSGKYKNDLICHQHFDQCSRGGMMSIIVGNQAYVHRLQNTLDWYSTEFIAEFMTIVQHDAHMSTPPFKTDNWVLMVFALYPNKPIKEALDYGD